MKKIFLWLFSLIFIFCAHTYASNILGGAITYKYVSSSEGSSTYKVTLELYATCYIPGMAEYVYPDLHGLSPEILVKKDGIIVNRPLLTYVPDLSGKDITPVCPASKDQTSCVNFSEAFYLGVQEYVYSGNVILNGVDSNWSFVFFGNVSDSKSVMINKYADNAEVYLESPMEGVPFCTDLAYLEATLNNTLGPNSSTTYTSPPIPFYCTGFKSYYGLGAVDPDFDQMKFEMTPVRANKMNVMYGTFIAEYLNPYPIPTRYYDPPFSGLRPLPTNPDSFYINSSNGQMTFTPNAARTCLVAVKTSEYRDGIVVGTTIREMSFFITDGCSSPAPNPTVLNIQHCDHAEDLEGNEYFSACEGLMDTASFDIHVAAPNSGGNITVTSDNLPPAAIMSIDGNGTPDALVHVKWDAIDAYPVTYFFYLTFSDNSCPYNTRRNVGYTFTIIPHNIKFTSGSSGSCAAVANGKAWVVPIGENTIDYTYKWVDTTTGNVFRNVSSKIGDTLSGVPPGNYKVYVRNNDGCGKNFFITIDTTPIPKIQLPNDSSVCLGMPILLNDATAKDSVETYLWSTGETSCCITAKVTGNYILTAQNHCGSAKDSVNMNFVKCNYCLFIPNAFTPNGDGLNDRFHITPTCLIDKYKIRIFNRWGQLVYISYDLYDDWDGTFGGKEQDQGTYYYSIEAILNNETKDKLQLKGDVILIK